MKRNDLAKQVHAELIRVFGTSEIRPSYNTQTHYFHFNVSKYAYFRGDYQTRQTQKFIGTHAKQITEMTKLLESLKQMPDAERKGQGS